MRFQSNLEFDRREKKMRQNYSALYLIFLLGLTLLTAGCPPYSFYGDVYLVGQKQTEAQKKRAIEISKKTEGVKSVTTYILQKKGEDEDSCGTTNSLEITAKVSAALIGDKDIWSTNVEVQTVQCNVVLLGLVGSQKEIEKSIVHAKGVEGVRSVKSFLVAVKAGK
jgi:hyperosmotically inducible protein